MLARQPVCGSLPIMFFSSGAAQKARRRPVDSFVVLREPGHCPIKRGDAGRYPRRESMAQTSRNRSAALIGELAQQTGDAESASKTSCAIEPGKPCLRRPGPRSSITWRGSLLCPDRSKKARPDPPRRASGDGALGDGVDDDGFRSEATRSPVRSIGSSPGGWSVPRKSSMRPSVAITCWRTCAPLPRWLSTHLEGRLVAGPRSFCGNNMLLAIVRLIYSWCAHDRHRQA